MAENIVLANLANLQNDTTTINTINGNNAIITSAFVDVLSRTGASPNQMNASLDMNNFPIMNLPAPGSANSPARLQDVTGSNPISISLSLAGDVTSPASSGVLTTTVGKVNGVSYPASPSTNTLPVVTGANTVTYQAVNTAQIANNAVTNAQIAAGTITSANIGTNVVANTNIRQGTALSVIGVTGSSTANVADIVGTTRQTLAVNTGGTGLVFAQPRGDQLLGTSASDNASVGNVGEYLSSTVLQASSVALTNNVAANITSLVIPAGDWDVWANPCFIPGATTSITNMAGYLSTTSATINPVTPFFTAQASAAFVPNTNPQSFHIAPIRVSVGGNTTYFLVALTLFTVSTLGGFGSIQARRVR